MYHFFVCHRKLVSRRAFLLRYDETAFLLSDIADDKTLAVPMPFIVAAKGLAYEQLSNLFYKHN